ncbi:hypothetical protein ElyMa_006925800 [Elysia marginata]|uniref:Uncharacterized protein n=1 Tax=Elysia marginata TaxID=1093978 RepID=A0AAV4JHB9_9GAST|nr:hypothetical protein ElyMa_006925800 [Elysia marginata]
MAKMSDEEYLNKDQTEATEEVREKGGFTPSDTILEALQANTGMINAMRKQIKDLQSRSRKRKRSSWHSVRSNHARKISSKIKKTKAMPRSDQLESDDDINALPPPSPRPASSAHETPLFSVVSPATNRDMDVASTDDEWVC